MSMLEQLVLAWQCLLYTARQILRPSLWAPWVLLGTLQALLVAALWWFAHPALSGFMVPLLRRLSGSDEVLHYPGLFEAMPSVYARADLVMGVTAGALAAGASTALFATRFAGQKAGAARGLGTALRRAGALLLVNLPLTLLVLGLGLALQAWAGGHGGLTARVARVVGIVGAVALQAAFLYVNALVIVGGHGARGALAELPRAVSLAGWAALALASFGFVGLMPFHELTSQAGAIVDRGRPELAGWALALQIAATLVVSFLLTGSSTLVYQSVVARRDDA